MKLICQGIDLSDAILKVVKACATKTTSPVLECIKLSAVNDTLTLTATDGEIAIVKMIKADIYEEGDICVPGKTFSDFIKKLEGEEITLTTVDMDRRMEIDYADSHTAMQILPAKDFPKVDIQIKENSFTMKTVDLKKVISSICFCCATDDSRPMLKGCQMVIEGNELTACALDGFRLATMKEQLIASTGDMEIICPARTLYEIDKMLPADDSTTEIFVQRGMILVSVENTILTSRLFGGDFIKKDNIIPKSFTTVVEVDRATLRSSIERAAILVRNDKNSLIIFDISAGRIEISSNSDLGNVKEPVKANVEGKDIRIAMNSKFITEAMSALTEEECVLSFNTAVQPFVCENKVDKQALYLILPVRTVQ